MKEEEKENILEEVKSGRYFEEALDWYNQIYIYPVIQRSALITITTISLLISIGSYFALFSFLPLVRPFSVAVENPAMEEYYVEVIKLKTPTLTEEEMVFEYFANVYVKLRETYVFLDLQRNLDIVKNMSSPQLYDIYSKFMNINNPSSPILRYRQNSTVKIANTQFFLDPYNPETKKPFERKARVFFDRIEITPRGGKVEKWVAYLTFRTSGFNFDQTKKTFPNPNFKVIDYRVALAEQARPKPATPAAGAQKTK